MFDKKYENQVKLLLKCLPVIFKEKRFAIKGGTAINLFYYNLPRLSVDIDLVYLPIEDRETTYANIHQALQQISLGLSNLGLSARLIGEDNKKIICSDGQAEIKIEPNYTLRGYVYEPLVMTVCPKAEDCYGYAKAVILSAAEV